MVANDVHDRRACAPRIVQIGEPVGEAWAEMKERGRWLISHAGVAIGSTCHYALGKPQHATHRGLAVERGDKMHLRSAWIGKTYIDAVDQQHVAKHIGA